jgi:hypothetical protein
MPSLPGRKIAEKTGSCKFGVSFENGDSLGCRLEKAEKTMKAKEIGAYSP